MAAWHGLIVAGLLMTCCPARATPAVSSDQTPPTQEVHIASDPGVVLAGSLELPNGLAPCPVVVVVLGTGPWTRGGFADIRTRLRAHGIATLIYDKRGQGRSSGAFVDTLPAMERDVAAAVAFLRTRPGIDASKIALLGISQGAVAAPEVASHDPAIAAVVALSGPVGSRADNFLTIMRANLAAGGRNRVEQDHILAATAAWMEGRSRRAAATEIAGLRAAAVNGLAANGFTRAQGEQFAATLDTLVVLSMYEAAPDEALRELHAPALLLFGTADPIIAADASLANAQAALVRNPDAMVVAVPGADHGFATADGGRRAAKGDYSIDPTLPGVTRLVADWLIARLRPSA